MVWSECQQTLTGHCSTVITVNSHNNNTTNIVLKINIISIMITLTFRSIVDVFCDKPCQSEVSHFDDVVVADQDVGGAHVAVNKFLTLEVLHSVCDLRHTVILVARTTRNDEDDDEDSTP